MTRPKSDSGLLFLLRIGLVLFGIGIENVNGRSEYESLARSGKKSGDTKAGKLDVAPRTFITFNRGSI